MFRQPSLDLARTRRHFFQDCAVGLGGMSLGSLLNAAAPPTVSPGAHAPGSPARTHFRPRAKAVIFLFMAGGPSQLELFEPKPTLNRLDGKATPESFTRGKRFAFLKPDARLLGSRRKFGRYGKAGVELGEVLPCHRDLGEYICVLKAVK